MRGLVKYVDTSACRKLPFWRKIFYKVVFLFEKHCTKHSKGIFWLLWPSSLFPTSNSFWLWKWYLVAFLINFTCTLGVLPHLHSFIQLSCFQGASAGFNATLKLNYVLFNKYHFTTIFLFTGSICLCSVTKSHSGVSVTAGVAHDSVYRICQSS